MSLSSARIKIGDSLIDLRFQRSGKGEVTVEVTNTSGSIKVEVEPQQEQSEAA